MDKSRDRGKYGALFRLRRLNSGTKCGWGGVPPIGYPPTPHVLELKRNGAGSKIFDCFWLDLDFRPIIYSVD